MNATTIAPRPIGEQMDNIKDTIESLVVAFILAFIFRGFLVEAFVIPTGSMAPGLYGVHGQQICPDCGWQFAYSLALGVNAERLRCPNCGWKSSNPADIPYQWRTDQVKEKLRDPRTANEYAHVDFLPQSGDRILVFKWVYDFGGARLGPKPWDVVVFKNPANGEDNYIKRLIGLPNEVLEIIDGDIYTCRITDLPPALMKMLDEVVRLKDEQYRRSATSSNYVAARARELMRQTRHDLQNKIVSQLNSFLRIRRKPDLAQQCLWQVVYHQDYLAPEEARRNRHRPGWRVEAAEDSSHWEVSKPVVTFSGANSPRQAIYFDSGDEHILDFYAYNFGSDQGNSDDNVNDLSLRLVLDYQSGEGPLTLVLSRGSDEFLCDLEPKGQVTLRHRLVGETRTGEILSSGHLPPLQPGHPLQLEFANVDFCVTLKANGATEPVVTTTDENYRPDIAALRSQPRSWRGPPAGIRIEAEKLDVAIRHLALYRDVYYKSTRMESTNDGWGISGNPIYLREGEYFMLGDNSPASQDSRLWGMAGPHLWDRGEKYQLGTVPEDQLIGRAFFVYWPSGYRVSWIPGLKSFGIIPNVGEMRWIR
ncbi:MAG: hypothetical protein HJJLKODD_01596 [Phycisphaerae bacterium]|nr:hypothetical protein [Phycisphaerae bacterium]